MRLPAAIHPCAPASQVHAIFEPKQDSTAKDLVLVAGPSDLALFLGNLKNLVLEKLL